MGFFSFLFLCALYFSKVSFCFSIVSVTREEYSSSVSSLSSIFNIFISGFSFKCIMNSLYKFCFAMNESSSNKSSKVLSLFSSKVCSLLFVLFILFILLLSSWDKVFLISSRFLLSIEILETFFEMRFFNLDSFSCFSFSNRSFSCLSFSSFSCFSFCLRSFSFCFALTSLKKSLIFSRILR